LGREVFYQAPLYPYFLALLQFFFGRDLWLIRVIQAVLGAASCVLLYWAGRCFFSRAAGVAAAVMLALYAPAIFFDALIQKTVLDVFLISLLLFLLSRARQKAHWSQWLAAGAVLGLLALSRENALVWVPVLAGWIWLYFNERRFEARLRWIAIFLTGLILVLLPVGMRNLKIGGEFALTTAQMGPNFFIGNNPVADGTYAPLRPGHGDPKFERQDATELAEQALDRNLSPGEVSRYWFGRAWDYITAHPLQWLTLMGKKWLMVWNVRELEDADDFYLYQYGSPLLKGLGVAGHFGILAPLAAMGCLLTWRQWRRLWVLHGLLLSMALSVAFFYVFARYRFPMIPLLTLLAGAGIIEGMRLSQTKLVAPKIGALAVLVLAAGIVNSPAIGKPGPSAAGYNNLGNAFSKEGKIEEAVDSYHQALRLEPGYGVAHYNLGNLFAQQNKFKEAEYHLAKAIEINLLHAEAYNSMGNILARQGQLEGAVQQYRMALKLGFLRDAVYFNLAITLIKLGRLDEASEILKESLKVNPDFAPAYHALGKILAAQGKLDEAIQHFRRAVSIQPGFADAHESLGRALAQRGNKDQAAKHYQEALRILRSQR
jgi:Flp pilus assembly protein TadD